MIEPNEPSPSPTASWADIFSGMEEAHPVFRCFSPAERVVASHVRRGLSNREIAQTLGKSEATVKNQVSACLRKCGARNRVQLIVRLG